MFEQEIQSQNHRILEAIKHFDSGHRTLFFSSLGDVLLPKELIFDLQIYFTIYPLLHPNTYPSYG